MPGELFLLPFRPGLDANAIPIVGARLEFYATGTSTPQAVYADEALVVSLGPIVTANSAGAWPTIYLDKTKIYRAVLRSPDGEVLKEADPYIASIVDNLAPEIAQNAAEAIQAASLAQQVAVLLTLYSGGYISIGTSAPPAGVGEGEGYYYTINGRLFAALNIGGEPSNIFEPLTAGTFGGVLEEVKNRANHFGTQAIDTIEGLQEALDALTNGGDPNPWVIRPEAFGAIATQDGGENFDSGPALLEALNTRKIVDLGGKTYRIGTSLKPTVFRELRNGRLRWLHSFAMVQQQYQLDLTGTFHDAVIDGVIFDLEPNALDTGSNDDSSRGGLKLQSSDQGNVFNDRQVVKNCKVTGAGNGTGLYIRSARNVLVENNIIYDRRVNAANVPTNDCMNGIDVSFCRGAKVINNTVTNHQVFVDGAYKYRFSRSILIASTQDAVISGNVLTLGDQMIDASGGAGGGNDIGNNNITISNNTISDCTTWGIKIANATKNVVVEGNVIDRWGAGGITVSALTVAGSMDLKYTTQGVSIKNNRVGKCNGLFPVSVNAGIRVGARGHTPDYPRDVVISGNVVNNTGGANMHYAYFCGVIYGGGAPVELLGDNRGYGFSVDYKNDNTVEDDGVTGGQFGGYRCMVTKSSPQTIANETEVPISWGNEIYDGAGMHFDQDENIAPTASGRYEINFNVMFAAAANGARRIRVLENGNPVPGGAFVVASTGGAVNTSVSGSLKMYIKKGVTIRLVAYQNSGTNVLVLPESVFSVEPI